MSGKSLGEVSMCLGSTTTGRNVGYVPLNSQTLYNYTKIFVNLLAGRTLKSTMCAHAIFYAFFNEHIRIQILSV